MNSYETENIGRRQALRNIGGFSGGVLLFVAGVKSVFANCEDCPDKTVPAKPCTDEDREVCIEDGDFLYDDVDRNGTLTSIAEIRYVVPNARLRVWGFNKVLPGKLIDPDKETPFEHIDYSRPAFVSEQLVAAAGSGWGEPVRDSNGLLLPTDTVEKNGHSYVINPETGNPAILYKQRGLGEVFRRGVDRVTRQEKPLPALVYWTEVLIKGQLARTDDGKLKRWRGIAYPCPPCLDDESPRDVEQMVIRRTVANYEAALARARMENDIVKDNPNLRLPLPESIRKGEQIG